MRPRVICSSKSACFLCNFFNAACGRFHITRTHGVVYEKSALPTVVTDMSKMMADAVDNFNMKLERYIHKLLSHGQEPRSQILMAVGQTGPRD